jgi:hypothetical protein
MLKGYSFSEVLIWEDYMIFAADYADVLNEIGDKFIVRDLRYVPDLRGWAESNSVDLHEPHQLMKLISADDTVTMFIQSEITDQKLDDNIRNLSVRWSMVDNMTDISGKLNTVKKRLVFSFLKEYARSLKDLRNDELLEDEWAMKAMKELGILNE